MINYSCQRAQHYNDTISNQVGLFRGNWERLISLRCRDD